MTNEQPSSPWPTALTWWALTRPVMLVAGLVGILLIGYGPPDSVTSWRVYPNSTLANLPARWDTFFYLDIATHGYAWNGSNVDGQNVAFFPAFPLAMHIVSFVTRVPPLWAGVLVAFTAFLLALVYLYRLASDLVDERTARWSVALLACYPGAVFFSAAYTESLFLLACLGAFWHMRKREALPAAAFALLAGLTRLQGFLICVPLAWMAWRRRDERAGWRDWLPVAAPMIALALFSAFMGWKFGRPLLWLENQAGWGPPVYLDLLHARVPPSIPSGHPVSNYDHVMDAWNYLAVVFVAAMVPFVWRSLGVEYLLFIGICMGPGLIGHPFTSMTRFSSVVFPCFIALASVLRTERRAYAVAGVLFAAQLFGAAMFFSWRHFF